MIHDHKLMWTSPISRYHIDNLVYLEDLTQASIGSNATLHQMSKIDT